MQEDKKRTPEEILEEARKRIGKETAPITAPYPVEYEPIRRYCMMVDDTNPLFLDPEYAEKARYGGVVLPPFAPFGIVSRGSPEVMDTLGGGEDSVLPPTPGKFLINLAQEWEWFRPVLVGDRLTTKIRLSDVYIKAIRIDPKAFWLTLEFEISNQRGEDVCLVRNILLSHRSPEEVATDA
ncbi:MAG: MaoC family dehydratase N-terminal domain-containing protein [Pseudomonadota bacterium]